MISGFACNSCLFLFDQVEVRRFGFQPWKITWKEYRIQISWSEFINVNIDKIIVVVIIVVVWAASLFAVFFGNTDRKLFASVFCITVFCYRLGCKKLAAGFRAWFVAWITWTITRAATAWIRTWAWFRAWVIIVVVWAWIRALAAVRWRAAYWYWARRKQHRTN